MNSFEVKGKVWRWKGDGPWFFVYVQKDLSIRIRDAARSKKKVGFSFVRIKATLGKTSWQTTLFPTKEGPYLIAIKADVRKKEQIDEGGSVAIKCALL
jgi:Domain of unknown function (DUF1905)